MEKSHQNVCLKKCTHVKTILKNPIQKKKTKHAPFGYSMFTNQSFGSKDLHSTKNKLDSYRGKDCMGKFCKDLREHAMKTINYEKEKKRYS